MYTAGPWNSEYRNDKGIRKFNRHIEIEGAGLDGKRRIVKYGYRLLGTQGVNAIMLNEEGELQQYQTLPDHETRKNAEDNAYLMSKAPELFDMVIRLYDAVAGETSERRIEETWMDAQILINDLKGVFGIVDDDEETKENNNE